MGGFSSSIVPVQEDTARHRTPTDGGSGIESSNTPADMGDMIDPSYSKKDPASQIRRAATKKSAQKRGLSKVAFTGMLKNMIGGSAKQRAVRKVIQSRKPISRPTTPGKIAPPKPKVEIPKMGPEKRTFRPEQPAAPTQPAAPQPSPADARITKLEERMKRQAMPEDKYMKDKSFQALHKQVKTPGESIFGSGLGKGVVEVGSFLGASALADAMDLGMPGQVAAWIGGPMIGQGITNRFTKGRTLAREAWLKGLTPAQFSKQRKAGPQVQPVS